jgi:hypothetical protein
MSLSLLRASFLEQLLDGGGKVVWCASSTSTMPSLGGIVLRSFGDRRALMDSCRTKALTGVMAVSMVDSVRGSASVYHSGDGWRELVEVTSEECAQDVFLLGRGVDVCGDRGTRSCV